MSRSVLVLGGGPDAERDVSIRSAQAVAAALKEAGRCAHLEIVDRPGAEAIARLPGDVIFPALHGAFGEGGPLQDVMERDGRPFVGSRASTARLAMDKVATKLAAARCGVATPEAAIVRPGDEAVGIEAPLVIKPVHEGSSVGLSICRSPEDASRALRSLDHARVWTAERMIAGRELTVGLLAHASGELTPLPMIEIVPAAGVYDFEAKYGRGDTRYDVDPGVPASAAREASDSALRVAASLGVRHVARVDFMLDAAGVLWFLEINTMPGFTETSLLPKAAGAVGLSLADVCVSLVDLAAGG